MSGAKLASVIGRTVAPSLGLVVGFGAWAVEADTNTDDDIWKNVFSSFRTPLGQLVDGTAEEGLSARYALDIPMKTAQVAALGSGLQGERASSPTLQFGLKYVPLSSWFVSVTFLKYIQSDLQNSWNPDFTYAFGYDDWRPYTFSAQYANYGGNRLRPDRSKGERYTTFNAGSWNLAFKFPLPALLQDVFLINHDDAIGCTVGATYTARYSDAASNAVLKGKRTVAIGCKYAFANNWYFNFSVPWYPVNQQKQPWDPEFTYGFGYFDWRPGTWSVQYNNYSGNRFPWNSASPNTGRLRDGSISISISDNWF